MERSPELFARALVEVQEALDWELLGELYCHEGGASFFPPEQRAAINETGFAILTDIAGVLEHTEPGGPGTSLYVGAGVAELVPILGETLFLARRVCAVTLPGAEADELNRALAAVEESIGSELPRIATTPVAELDVAWEHLWLVSVLSDPETFPALSDAVYERGAPLPAEVLRDSERALSLVADCLRGAHTPAILTTTDEELPLVLTVAKELRRNLRVPEQGRLSAIVGDPVRHCLLT